MYHCLFKNLENAEIDSRVINYANIVAFPTMFWF